MTADDTLIEQIVNDVMRRLDSSPPSPPENGIISCAEKIITRELLEQIWKTGSQLAVGESSLITPSARDFISENAIVVVRGSSSAMQSEQSNWRIVVHKPFTKLKDLWSDFEVHSSSCFEESLQHFLKLLTQSPTNAVFVVEHPELVVCKANREKSIRACHINDVSRLDTIWKQLKPNLICLSPESFSDFELKSFVRKIVAIDRPSTGRSAR